MTTIGLIGGIASGKSAVAAGLAARGAVVFDADRIGHRVLQEPAIRDALVARWGRDILDADGRVSRPAVAARVFGDGDATVGEREYLESLLHPLIRARIEAEIIALPSGEIPAVVIDAPLLIESGWHEICQAVAFIDAPREVRRARAQQQRGWSLEEFDRREAAQMPISHKRAASTHVIDNAGTPADLDCEIERFWTAAVA